MPRPVCGLFGSIGFEPDPGRLDLVAHRGPDGRGWRVFDSNAGPVALGHRRLSIIDVSDAGTQPMSDADGRFWLVFNGEIYNFIELRAELEGLGETFMSRSDSEVLLLAYRRWGAACLPKLRGMFAFLIYDRQKQHLFAARDRFGIKPLYLAQSRHGIALASEIKQLLGLPGLSNAMNLPRVHDFLASGIADHTGETMFADIAQLRGGEYLSVDVSGGAPHVTRKRWYVVPEQRLNLSESDASEQFRALLTDAVRLHLRSDVTVGSCLSGGLDSSSIVCLMAGMMPEGADVNTVSACYAERRVDEKPFMDAVVAHAGTTPHFIFPRAEDVFQRADEITWHQDEPFGSTSIFAQWCVFEEARRAGIKVMLDGQGADEPLAGYHNAFPIHFAHLLRSGQFTALAQGLRARQADQGAPIARQLASVLKQMLPAPIAGMRANGRSRASWLNADYLAVNGNPDGAEAVGHQIAGLPPVTDLHSLGLSMTFATNLPMLLHWEDRSSMAHSIEARVPFLDHPLVEFTLALGNDHKIAGGDTKRVLRRAMAETLPAAVRDRRDKLGFATPEEEWFRGPLRALIHQGTEETLARYPDLFNASAVRTLRDDMLDGRRAFDFTLWRIVNLGIWGRRFAATPG